MSYVIGIVTTKDGQGSTTLAVALATELALHRSTLLIDADMSGTGTAIDSLHLDGRGLGMNHLVGHGKAITQQMLLNEVVSGVREWPSLGVVPGLDSMCGSDLSTFLEQLKKGKALEGLPYDFLVLDVGAAWAHPWLRSPRAEAQALAEVCNRVLVVMPDSPARLTRGIQVLRLAHPPRAEIVLTQSRGGALKTEVAHTLKRVVPDLGVAATVKWDPDRVAKAENRGEPVRGLGAQLVSDLRLLDALASPDGGANDIKEKLA